MRLCTASMNVCASIKWYNSKHIGASEALDVLYQCVLPPNILLPVCVASFNLSLSLSLACVGGYTFVEQQQPKYVVGAFLRVCIRVFVCVCVHVVIKFVAGEWLKLHHTSHTQTETDNKQHSWASSHTQTSTKTTTATDDDADAYQKKDCQYFACLSLSQ